MKKTLLLALLALPLAAPAAEGVVKAAAPKAKAKAAAPKAVVYTCPMHPEVSAGQPGSCPKCHMDLVPRKEKAKAKAKVKAEAKSEAKAETHDHSK